MGACATTGLWVSLHPLCDLFGISVNSPAEITEKSVSFPAEYRSFPSSGLSLLQMITFIKSRGLDLESIDITSERSEREYVITDAVKAYIKAGIPIIATIRLEKGSIFDYHAVVIGGYRCDQDGVIKELYVHDDQIGPYSPVVSRRRFIEWENEWVFAFGYDRALIEKLLIPIYPKIRLIFASIYEVYMREKQHIISKGLAAELFLTQVGEYKGFLRNHFIKDKVEILTTPLPRFLWIIRSHLEGMPVIDIYDGTSVIPKRLLTVQF